MLEKVTVDPSFWELFPDAQVNIMLVSGIDNHDTADNLARRRKLLREGSDKAEDFLGAAAFAKNPVVAEWRQAYQQFKKKKGVRASIEAPVDGSVAALTCLSKLASLTVAAPCDFMKAAASGAAASRLWSSVSPDDA